MQKRISMLLLTFIMLLSFISPVCAANNDSIESIIISVDIQDNGDVKIRETWSVFNGGEGTEWYKPMTNLNHMELKDFKVEFNGVEGEYVDNWNVKGDFNQKKNKYGINKTKKGFELCWGKSEQGKIEYTISYTYTNFVQKVKTDPYEEHGILNAFNAKLVNDSMSPAPDKVSVIIKANGYEFNETNTEIYAFGTDKGYIEFEDGNITFNGGPFSSSNQLITMVGTTMDLGAQYQSDKTYQEIKDTALSGSDYQEDEPSFFDKCFPIFMLILNPAVFLFILITKRNARIRAVRNAKTLDYASRPYNRESIVKDNSLPKLASATEYIPGVPQVSLRTLLASQIIKWMNDGVLEIIKDDFGDDYKIRITGKEPLMDDEKSLYKMVTDKVGIGVERDLTNKDFSKIFSSKPNTTASSLTRYFPRDYKELLRPHIQGEKKGNYLTKEGIDLFINIRGAYEFLKDFTLIKERTINELKLWEDYMVQAVFFGMPDKVIKELEKAAPRIVLENEYSNTMNSAILVSNSVSRNFYRIYQAANRSSGGGGRSSSGGGGGSSGGGSGGGSR